MVTGGLMGRCAILSSTALVSSFSQRSAAPFLEARGAPSVQPRRNNRGSGAPEGASINFTPCGGLCEARRCEARTHLAMRPPPGAPPRHLQAAPFRWAIRHQPRAALLEPAFAPANAASSSQGDRSVARAGSRSRPSAGLRDLPAGAASDPAEMTSHDNALGWIERRKDKAAGVSGDK